MLSWGVRLGTAAGAAACLLSLVACSDEDPGDAPEPNPGAASSASPDDDLSGLLGGEPAGEGPKDPKEAVVLDQGDEPRIQPTVEVTVGQRFASTLQMTMTTSVNGMGAPSIPMTMVSSTEVQEVTDEVITIRGTFDEVDVDEARLPKQLVTQLESGLAALEGLAITIDQSPSGALLDTRFALPDNAPPSAHQMVEQIAGTLTTYSVPMPTEAVGEGASWMVVDTVESNGITMTQTSTYVLEELDGDQYRISSEVDGTVDPVDLGGGVELVRGSLSGDGETVGAFGDLMPASGTSELSTTMVIQAAGRRAETVTDVDMTMTTELE